MPRHAQPDLPAENTQYSGWRARSAPACGVPTGSART